VYGDGAQTRSFCYIGDLLRGIKAVMNHDDNDVFNLGNPDETTILELAEIIQDVVDTESEIIHQDLPEDDPGRRRPSIQRTQHKLGFSPRISIQEGLKDTADHFT
jgi:nucleoside-diphosphate-sugar epimerase